MNGEYYLIYLEVEKEAANGYFATPNIKVNGDLTLITY